jgi:hypothetical protein
LIDLYCDTGQPEKALELLNTGNADDPSLGTEPGSSAYRQARVSVLLGNYDYATLLLRDRAISQVRYARAGQAISAGVSFVRGQVKPAIASFLEQPGKLATQAAWELDLALCLLESGKPELAASSLTNTLTLAPDQALRPVAAYYLEKIGKPVPPASDKPTIDEKAADKTETPAQPTGDEKPDAKKEAAADEEKKPQESPKAP